VQGLATMVGEVMTTLHHDTVHLYAEGTACAVAHVFAKAYPLLVNSVMLRNW
jgi:hypothetical protein